jgi:hypothetical protein
MTKISKSEKVPKQMKAKFDAIVMLAETFCNEHLNEEYAQLARQAVAALCRKRPSPLLPTMHAGPHGADPGKF